MYGLASGVTGLLVKPMEGAIKNGPAGFVRGIGIGVVGVAVNPVLGVTDGLNAVAQTLFVQSSEGQIRQQIRSARTFICILREDLYPHPYPYPMLSGLMVLVPIDLYAVYAQATISSTVKSKAVDLFIGYQSLLKTNPSTDVIKTEPAVFLSARYLWLRALNEIQIQENSEKLSKKGSMFSWNNRGKMKVYIVISYMFILYVFIYMCIHIYIYTYIYINIYIFFFYSHICIYKYLFL
jgi:DNA-binding transcriptional regulator of glucitol operon